MSRAQLVAKANEAGRSDVVRGLGNAVPRRMARNVVREVAEATASTRSASRAA